MERCLYTANRRTAHNGRGVCISLTEEQPTMERCLYIANRRTAHNGRGVYIPLTEEQPTMGEVSVYR